MFALFWKLIPVQTDKFFLLIVIMIPANTKCTLAKEQFATVLQDKKFTGNTKNKISDFKTKKMKKESSTSHTSNAIYGLGIIGAAIFYISQATGFWIGVLGFLKAIVWPVFLVYEAFMHFAS